MVVECTDPYFKVKYKTSNKGTLNFAFWAPMLATNVKSGRMDNSNNPIMLDKGLGWSFDLTYKHKFSKEVMLMVGASYFIMSDAFKEMKKFKVNSINPTRPEAGKQYFLYTMLVIKPKFFNSQKK